VKSVSPFIHSICVYPMSFVQSHLQHYFEPQSDTDTLPASNSALSNTILPLRPGTLTHNHAGLPIIVDVVKPT